MIMDKAASRIRLQENSDIPFGELGKVLDAIIETGGRSQQEHYQRLQEFLHGR